MARSKPRIVVIGAGRLAAKYHLPSLQHLARTGACEFAAVCDLNAEAAAQAARRFGARAVYTDFVTMLRELRPDGVCVYTRMDAMAAVGGAVLRMGYPMLVEKPPGRDARDTRALIRAARAGRAPNMVAFNRRFCPVIVQGREALRAHGPIKGASCRFYRHRRGEPDFWGTAIHGIDALRFLGGEMDRVTIARRVLARGEQPAFSFFIEYANGGVGHLAVRPQAGMQIERYELFGRDAVVQIRAGVGWLVDAPGACELYVENKPQPLPDPLAPFKRFRGDLREAAGGGFYGENAAFVAGLRRGRLPGPSLAESLPSMEIALAMHAGRNWKRR